MKRYEKEFQIEAVKQVVERGYSQLDVARRLGISPVTLRAWMKKHATTANQKIDNEKDLEIARLKAELKRVEEERDIMVKATAYFSKKSH